jgi:PAS domain S-box-containing protein
MLTTIELRKRYVIYVRAVLSISIILVGIYNYSSVTVPKPVIWAFIAALIISNLVFQLIPAREYKGIKLHYMVFILDIAFITAGAYIFTHLDLQFIIAVFLTVFMAALSQSVGFSIFIAVVVNAIYIYIKYIMGANVLDENTLLNIPFMFVVALHSSYLAEKANEELKEKSQLEKINLLLTKKLTSKSKEAAEVIDFTRELCDSFKQAIIVLDEDGEVRVFNAAAEKIFGIKKERAIDMPVKALAVLDGVKDAFMALKFGNEEYDGKTVAMKNTGETLRVWTSYIKNSAAEVVGILCCAQRAG